MLEAPTEADARLQLAGLPHACGDTTFAPPLKRSHDELGLWLVFRGPCPRCGEERVLRFRAAAPARCTGPRPVGAASPVAPAPAALVVRGGSEERELYGTSHEARCTACDGAGESTGVTGDYAIGLVRCGVCRGTGRVTTPRD